MAPNLSESALMASLQAELFHWKTFVVKVKLRPVEVNHHVRKNYLLEGTVKKK